MAAKSYASPTTPRDAETIAGATGYAICGFRGRGQFDKAEHKTIEEARAAAKTLAQTIHRPVAVYAVMESPCGIQTRQAHMENVDP